MKKLFLIAAMGFFSSCNLSDETPQRSQSSNQSNNQSTTSTNQPDTGFQETNNRTIAPNNGSSTAGTTSDSKIEIPFTSLIEKGRSKRGLVAAWKFDDLNDDGGYADSSGNNPPMDFERANAIYVNRIEGRNGVRLSSTRAQLRVDSADRLYSRLTAANRFTIELWLEPTTLTNSAGRILSYEGVENFNFRFFQVQKGLLLHLNTKDKDIDFTDIQNVKEVVIPNVFELRSIHFVWIYDGNNSEIWVDGEKKDSRPLPGGLESWQPDSAFGFGSWSGGEVLYAAIYDRALRPAEVQHHFALGSLADPEVERLESSTFHENCIAWDNDLFLAESFAAFDAAHCSAVEGDLQVAEESRDKLSFLSELKTIGGSLVLRDIVDLNLNALSNLQEIGGDLIIDGNLGLESISALSNLKTLGGSLIITNNARLKSTDGLSRLSQITGHLIIAHNDKLLDLKGLDRITQVNETLIIDDNRRLEDVSDLALLVSANQISISRLPAASLALPALRSSTKVWIREMDALPNALFLRDIRSPFYFILSNDRLTSLSLPGTQTTSVFIEDNYSLSNLSGMSSIKELRRLRIKGGQLRSLELLRLENVEAQFEIIDAARLFSLEDALPKLQNVGGLYIINTNVERMRGAFDELRFAQSITILDNDRLPQINRGFSSFVRVFDLTIQGNPLLDFCDLQAFENRVDVTGASRVYGNKPEVRCF